MSANETKALEARATQYRDYPEELKAACISAIEANGGQIRPTARLFNIPYDTIHYWWTQSERYRQIQPASALNLADKLENIAYSYADSIADHDLSIVPVRDKAAVMDTAIKNMQLLRGQATSISASVDSDEDRQRKLAEIFGRIEARALEGEVNPESMVQSSDVETS